MLPRALAGLRTVPQTPPTQVSNMALWQRDCTSDGSLVTVTVWREPPVNPTLFPVAGLVAHTAPSCFSCPLVLIGLRTAESTIIPPTWAA